MANTTAANATLQLHDEFETAIVIWYAAVGICGLIGNCFVIAVTSSRSHLNSSHLMIIWLGCTDLICCLSLPIRYKLYYQTMTGSPALCAVGRWIVVFLIFLSINSLATVAIERYKAVQNINRDEQLSKKTVRALVVLCVLTSVVFTIPFIWFLNSNTTSCSKLDKNDISVYTNFIGFTVTSMLTTLSTFILITVLYVKICILVRTRVSQQRNPVQQLPNENSLSEPVRPTEGKAESDFSQRTREPMNLHQVKEDDEYHRRESDVVGCEFVDLQLIEETPSQLPNNAASSRSSMYMISGTNPMSGPLQSEQESVSSCKYPGPSTSSLHQIPGLVMDERDNESQIPPTKMHSTIIAPDSNDSRNNEPVIPVLNDQNQHNFMITSKVTCMLFTVTLVFFVTYVISSIVLFFPHGKVRQFFRESVLINHAINPVIYSIANKGFRESCISFVNRIRERFGF